MDYEKKYKEALERAKECLQDGTITTIARDYIWEIFPELKDEDERIRKWCISHFNACINVIKDNDEYKEYLSNKVIAWLEKQGEKKPADYEYPHWISVADELPKEHEWILGYSLKRSYVDTYIFNSIVIEAHDITHWMRLSPPPIVSNSGNAGKKGGENESFNLEEVQNSKK